MHDNIKIACVYGKKLYYFRTVFAICTALVMFAIFMFSSQNGSSSSKTSGELIYKLSKLFISNLSYEKRIAFVNGLQFVFRKSAHFFAYFVLGVSVFGFFSTLCCKVRVSQLISFVICVLYSVSDEIHQLFVLERSGEIRDVLIDSAGSFFGIILLYIVLKKLIRSKLFTKG